MAGEIEPVASNRRITPARLDSPDQSALILVGLAKTSATFGPVLRYHAISSVDCSDLFGASNQQAGTPR